jgi:ubiquinone/menaquinone biosynthesis C-methylase UbiE
MHYDWHELYREMVLYYEARAHEYDDIYLGKGPAIPDAEIYIRDVAKIGAMAQSFGTGHVIDIACGTGFWLPYYTQNCSRITLFDYSHNMLALCQQRVDALGLRDQCQYIQGDVFTHPFRECLFDGALIGFFVCHLSLAQEQEFFTRMHRILKPHAQCMFIDSAWSKERAHYRDKEGVQKRTLNDGQVYTIYKRYFDESDSKNMFKKYALKLDMLYMGTVFLGAVGFKI